MGTFNKTFFKFVFGFITILLVGLLGIFLLGSQNTSTPATTVGTEQR